MKKLLALAVVAGGVLFAVKRKQGAKAEAELWREATAPYSPTGASSNNGTRATTTSADSAR